MTVYTTKPAINLREELASLRNQGGYSEQQFYFDGLVTEDYTAYWSDTGNADVQSDQIVFSSSLSDQLDSTLDVAAGKSYAVSFTISGHTGGSLEVRFSGPFTNNLTVSANGNYSFFAVYGGTQGLRLRSSVTLTATVSNIAIFKTDANDDVIHTMPKGWKPKDVFEDGLLQREGAANDYTVIYDGFDYVIKPAVAPSATTQTCVIGVRA